MKTTDFTGTYDYEREMAQSEAKYFLEEIQLEFTPVECQTHVAKLKTHWTKVLSTQGFTDFRDEWNKLVPQFPMP